MNRCLDMVSFLEELFLSYDKLLKKGIKEIRREYNVKGLEEIIKEIKNLKKLGYYERLHQADRLGSKIVGLSGKTGKKEHLNVPLIKLARENLPDPSINLSYVATFSTFDCMYTFLEYTYYMNSRRKLERENVKNIYYSGLAERIVFALNKFDKIKEIPVPSAEFFIKLKEIKWKDKKAKEFSLKLYCIFQYAGRDIVGSHMRFNATEAAFLELLAGCSAVNDGRDKIIEEDVIRSFKTYFKLMKTDITKLVDKGVKHYKPKVYEGYLVCHDCGGYYQLQPGESPDDFSDTCECGGHLEYKENIEE